MLGIWDFDPYHKHVVLRLATQKVERLVSGGEEGSSDHIDHSEGQNPEGKRHYMKMCAGSMRATKIGAAS